MRKSYGVPALLIILVLLYLVYSYTNREGFESDNTMLSMLSFIKLSLVSDSSGNENEVRFPFININEYLRLAIVNKNQECVAPRGSVSYAYAPEKDYVSPTGKKICMIFRNINDTNVNNLARSFTKITGTRSQGEVLMQKGTEAPIVMRLQYTTNGICTIPNPNTSNFLTFLYNPTRDLSWPNGKKMCITLRHSV